MAITSYGFPGTIDSVQWAKLAEELGAAYSVLDRDDWKVSVVVGPDRTVAVAAGTAFGRGVMDVNSAPINIQLPTVASGVRYDLICARRNWGTPATTATYVQGTSTAAIPAGRNATPGTLDDQPLALVKITAGSTVPVIEADLRMLPSKVTSVFDLRGLVDPKLGDEIVHLTTGVRYRRVLDVGNNPVWEAVSPKVWTATRATASDDWPMGTWGSMASLSLPASAPAGNYEISASVAAAYPSSTGRMDFRLEAGGATVWGPIRGDRPSSPGGIDAPVVVPSFRWAHGGGASSVGVSAYAATGTGRVFQAGTYLTVEYKGP